MPIAEGPRSMRVAARAADTVPVIPWPAGHAERHQRAVARLPRLLAISAGASPPEGVDELEDWVRVPVDLDELSLRQRTLHERWRAGRAELWLDEHGLVHRDARWVSLSDAQAVIAAPLIASAGHVVRRADVRAACAAAGAESDAAFKGVLRRLQSKLGELGATLHILSGGRLLLELCSSPSRSSDETLPK
jgi:alkanesulfonate monooxygenase SsuD/methylene tetrahydromethanopterin reductase-like flavin-dependent oxidoreductase (luciferase family)